VYQLPTESRPAIAPARVAHFYLNLTPDQLAAIIADRGTYLEEDR